MNSILRRRRALMGGLEKSEWTTLSPTWTTGRVISSGGTESSGSNGAVSNYYELPNITIKRTGQRYDDDGKQLSMYVHEYNGTTWLKRTAISEPGDTMTLSANCTKWRFAYLYPQAAGKQMTYSVISTYFGAEYKEA